MVWLFLLLSYPLSELLFAFLLQFHSLQMGMDYVSHQGTKDSVC